MSDTTNKTRVSVDAYRRTTTDVPVVCDVCGNVQRKHVRVLPANESKDATLHTTCMKDACTYVLATQWDARVPANVKKDATRAYNAHKTNEYDKGMHASPRRIFTIWKKGRDVAQKDDATKDNDTSRDAS